MSNAMGSGRGWSVGLPGRVCPRLELGFGSISGMRSVFAFLLLSLALLSGGVAQAESQSAGAPLDLNRATAEQLEALPGIGAVKAAAILAVRDTKGGFGSMEELEAVRGIGPALVEKLRPLVKVGKTPARSGKPARN
jgi:competence ComEA-like helix-hairpin-helix protein